MSRVPSAMNHTFSEVPRADIPRSQFNRSHGYKTTFNAGKLIPVFVDEALPGDTFNVRMTAFARLSTPIVPFMDNLYCDSFFFAVPYRLVWDNWQRFNGEQTDPGDSTNFLIPQMTVPVGGYLTGSLSDYFGLPILVDNFSHSSLWHRAYNLIYNEWFRDQNVFPSVPVPLGDGPDTDTDFILQNRGKRHDYFTSCLPFPQKGPAVTIPLGSTAPVVSDGSDILMQSDVTLIDRNFETAGGGGVTQLSGETANTPVIFGSNTGLEVDLTAATASTINSLRQAFQIQRLYERDARGGTRYTEIIKSHFGVTSPDARLQRPELLGTHSTMVTVNPIAQTSSTDATTPQGNLAAIGTVTPRGGFVKSFTEHCLIVGMISVRADLNYQQTLNRMWSRSTRFDFYWPALAHIGEQAVLNKEIFCEGVPLNDEAVFGYQERFAEYRYKPSQITGQFRSQSPTPLDIWHLAQDYPAAPVLTTPVFMNEDPPISRIVAVPSEPNFLFDAYFSMKTARPMPTYSVPGLIDHF